MGGAEYSFTVHGPEEFDKPEFIHLAEKIKYSRFTVAISSFGKSQLSRLVDHEHWGKIKIVHCGLDSTFLDNSGFHKVTNTRQFVCVGRLCEQKGQILLIDAMAKLHKAGVDCHLVLAGDGEMRNVIEQRIKELNLEELVTITGWVTSEEVKQLLLDSRAMVLPSFAEGLPVVIMEAMALHRPVISTYIAGIPELVVNGENGYLVPAGDVNALASAMKVALETSETQTQSMSNAAYQAVKQQHDINTEAAKLVELFKQSSDYGTH
jgi:glycosyltransferase involved in cell wall biosynthesis